MSDKTVALRILIMNTLAFTVCFACWMMNGVLVTFLVDHGVFRFDRAQIGWLMGVPVLSGSILRLPVGVLTDKYGGRRVFTTLMLLSAIPVYLVSTCTNYSQFLLASLAFGCAGASFAVGIAYTSVCFPKEKQGTALGIFGVGNAGAALSTTFAPIVLARLTHAGRDLEGWRTLPKIYAAILAVTAVLFFLLTVDRRVAATKALTFTQRLAPLKRVRVWRFGLYYFLVFGGFVALAQWLVPYYVGGYGMSIATAGLLASIFSLPSGIIRALGGWMSDRMGARSVMYWVLGSCLVSCLLLVVPKMTIESPGEAVLALRGGTVTAVSGEAIVVDGATYPLAPMPPEARRQPTDESFDFWPDSISWNEPAVAVGDTIVKRQLLARGVTRIHFQSNVWVFTVLVFVVGIMMGIGKAAVYRHIPDYFPDEVGVVGGMVGVIGGLGGFFCPIVFGYLLRATGLWTTCWMFFFVLSATCLAWMHVVVRRMLRAHAPTVARLIEDPRKGATA